MAAASPPNASRAEALAYVEEQDLVELLNQALTQVVKERAPNGAARIAELLKKAARLSEWSWESRRERSEF